MEDGTFDELIARRGTFSELLREFPSRNGTAETCEETKEGSNTLRLKNFSEVSEIFCVSSTIYTSKSKNMSPISSPQNPTIDKLSGKV